MGSVCSESEEQLSTRVRSVTLQSHSLSHQLYAELHDRFEIGRRCVLTELAIVDR